MSYGNRLRSVLSATSLRASLALSFLAVLAGVTVGIAFGPPPAAPPLVAPSGVSVATAIAPRTLDGGMGIEFRGDGRREDVASPLLSTGIKEVTAAFPLPPDCAVTDLRGLVRWRGGQAVSMELREGTDGGTCEASVSARALGDGATFGPGIGEVEISHRGKLLVQGSFVVAGKGEDIAAQEIPASDRLAVVSLRTMRDASTDGTSGKPTDKFGSGDRIWALFEYRQAGQGERMIVRWRYRGQLLPGDDTSIVATLEAGRGVAWMSPVAGNELPEGPYTVEVAGADAGTRLASASFSVVPERKSPPR